MVHLHHWEGDLHLFLKLLEDLPLDRTSRLCFLCSYLNSCMCCPCAEGSPTGTGTVGGLVIGVDTTPAGKVWGIFQVDPDVLHGEIIAILV